MTTWEYKQVDIFWGVSGFDEYEHAIWNPSLEEQLNTFGKDGWEVVEIHRYPRGCDSGEVLLKRTIVE